MIESGSELWARLAIAERPSLQGLEPRLFGEGPRGRQTVELRGDSSSGKTLLLTQLVARCILPRECDGIAIQGREAAAVLVNTDHHFRVSQLIRAMLGVVEAACNLAGLEYSEETMKRRVALPAIEKLRVIDCYDNNEFRLALERLDDLLTIDPAIALIAVDSVSSFYWLDREIGGVWSIDRYVRDLLKIVQRHNFQHNVVTIYTRPRDFASKGPGNSVELADEPVAGKIDCRIDLRDSRCAIETARGRREIGFEIGDEGLVWNTEKTDFVDCDKSIL